MSEKAEQHGVDAKRRRFRVSCRHGDCRHLLLEVDARKIERSPRTQCVQQGEGIKLCLDKGTEGYVPLSALNAILVRCL